MQAGDDDARLMLAFQRGDAAAFDALFHRWAYRLLRYLTRMLRDAGAAEELVQEVFLRVFGARDRYVPEARFSTWLYRIATNLALNELRRPHRRARHEPVGAVEASGCGLELAAGGTAADDLAHARRVGDALQLALGALPERQRAALWLAAVEGLSYAEVAESLETTENSVKALVHRARSALAHELRAEES